MKMKFILSLLILARMTVSLFAAETTVAVYNFAGKGGARSYRGKVTALVTADLATTTNLILLERSELNEALNEQAFGNSGMVSSDAAAKIGQITGAKVLVSGQVLTLGHNHLVIIANIIGTETARLFAVKVEGAPNNLTAMTSDLSSKIAQTIVNQTTNLIREGEESIAARLDRIAKSVTGTNRPTVSVKFNGSKNDESVPLGPFFTATIEMEILLQKAGFVVVDADSEQKPDVMITGEVTEYGDSARAGLHIARSFIELKVQERRSGLIIALDRQESLATSATQMGSQRSAEALATDELAERFLPLLAK
jgi:hypothetical protein